MSRIGKQPISIPDKVKFEIVENRVTVTGPKGTIEFEHHRKMRVTMEDSTVNILRPDDSKTSRALHGLTRALINNMVVGVTSGFKKSLEIIGVGYRAELKGSNLQLALGFSHPIIAAKIRSFRRPEPYKGKGIRYEGEHVRRKAGKTAA